MYSYDAGVLKYMWALSCCWQRGTYTKLVPHAICTALSAAFQEQLAVGACRPAAAHSGSLVQPPSPVARMSVTVRMPWCGRSKAQHVSFRGMRAGMRAEGFSNFWKRGLPGRAES